ncbi:MAG: helix-turn-helix domain-containing protein [Candidatus Altiarchaeota archaeon]
MKLDLTPVYAALGLGVATYVFLRVRKVNSPVKFNDVLYDKENEHVELVVENTSGKPFYVKPSLRAVKLTPVSEWREKTSNGNGAGIPMMTASAGSVIKGYELIGEYAEPVMVPAHSTVSLKYPLMRDFGLKASDNIRVDASFGSEPLALSGNTSSTIRMNLRELSNDRLESILAGEDLDAILDALDEYIQDSGMPYPQKGSVADVVEVESKDSTPEPLGSKDVSEPPKYSRNEYPLESMCYCCGKTKWLNWLVNDNHVCDDCREYLVPQASDSEEQQVDTPSGIIEDEAVDEASLELVYKDPVNLKPRHEKILDILNSENTASAKDISRKLGRKEKNIAADLRYLMGNGLVDRVKIGRAYKYFSLRDSEQVVLGGEELDDDTIMLT